MYYVICLFLQLHVLQLLVFCHFEINTIPTWLEKSPEIALTFKNVLKALMAVFWIHEFFYILTRFSLFLVLPDFTIFKHFPHFV